MRTEPAGKKSKGLAGRSALLCLSILFLNFTCLNHDRRGDFCAPVNSTQVLGKKGTATFIGPWPGQRYSPSGHSYLSLYRMGASQHLTLGNGSERSSAGSPKGPSKGLWAADWGTYSILAGRTREQSGVSWKAPEKSPNTLSWVTTTNRKGRARC